MRAWLEISRTQLQKNLFLLKQDMPAGLHYFCVIKDNAFGHDAKIVAEEALKIGATYLAVSCLFEALDLERQGISKPIFILYDRFEDELETCIYFEMQLWLFTNCFHLESSESFFALSNDCNL